MILFSEIICFTTLVLDTLLFSFTKVLEYIWTSPPDINFEAKFQLDIV